MKLRSIFTLIELLVVISIIVILISILLPALRNAKEKTYEISCKNNLKNLHAAMTMYVNDYNDYFPRDYVAGPPYTDCYWAQLLLPYTNGNPLVFNCSKFTITPALYSTYNYYYHFSSGKGAHYGYNHRLLGCNGTGGYSCIATNMKIGRIRSPSNVIMCVDHRVVFANPPSLAQPVEYYYPYQHIKGVNILFIDGHVNRFPITSDYFTLSTASGWLNN